MNAVVIANPFAGTGRGRLGGDQAVALLREAGLLYGARIKRSTCRLLCWLGRALVALGEQLEQLGQPQWAPH